MVHINPAHIIAHAAEYFPKLAIAPKMHFCKGCGEVQSFSTDNLGALEMCPNCDGKGYVTCTTCNGTSIQPRYLDRREFQDDD